jgi:Ca2+-transporting ATPase
MLVIIVNSAIGFMQDYKSEKTMENLRRMATPVARVMRAGRVIEVSTTSLVVGDILVIEEGDMVAADCRLIEVQHLQIDEALLTGEGLSVTKKYVV